MGNGGNYYSLYLTATQAMATIALIICNCFLNPVYIVSECIELSFDTAWIPPDSTESYRLLSFSALT